MYIGTGGFSNSSVNSGHHQSKFAGDDPQGWDGLGILVLMWPSDSPGGVSCNLNGVKPCGDVTGMMARIGMIIPKCPNFSGWWIMMCFSKNRDRIVAMWWCFVGLTWPYRFFTPTMAAFLLQDAEYLLQLEPPVEYICVSFAQKGGISLSLSPYWGYVLTLANTDTHRHTQTHTDTHRHTHRQTHTDTHTHRIRITQNHTESHISHIYLYDHIYNIWSNSR